MRRTSVTKVSENRVFQQAAKPLLGEKTPQGIYTKCLTLPTKLRACVCAVLCGTMAKGLLGLWLAAILSGVRALVIDVLFYTPDLSTLASHSAPVSCCAPDYRLSRVIPLKRKGGRRIGNDPSSSLGHPDEFWPMLSLR